MVLMKTMMMMMMMDLCRPTSTLGQAGINTGATEEPLLTGSSQIFDINVILIYQIFKYFLTDISQIFEPLWDLNFDEKDGNECFFFSSHNFADSWHLWGMDWKVT